MKLSTEKMLAEADGHIGWITFNNPARHNAVSLEMWQGLGDALEAFAEDNAIRVIILRGAGGRAFVSGADISEFDTKRASAEQRRQYGEIAARGNRALRQAEKPLIAMIQGYCIGGGLAIALNADVRFGTPGSRFGIPAARLGLGYDYQGVATLARLVGPSVTRDILFSARLFGADEALAMGLINRVIDDAAIEAEVRDYAATMAGNAPLTIRAAKAAVDEFERDSSRRDLARVEQLVNACFDSEDYREGRRAFAEKRPPRFEGR